MIRVKYDEQEYKLENLVWSGDDQATVEFLQTLTSREYLSGADTDPDLATGLRLQKDLGGLEIFYQDEPEYNPDEIY